MKINNLTFVLLLSIILSALVVAGYVFVHHQDETARLENPNQAKASESYATASISKETILFLLAAGIIGVLGVSRKKKDIGSYTPGNANDRAKQHPGVHEDRQKRINRSS
jgi:DMSO reductase anchor subunit